jgi:signal transduction histidine kinase
MQKLGAQVNRLANLVTALLDTSRISEGQLQLHTEEFDLDTLIEERIEELRRLSQKHVIKFSAGKLPPIMADRERISQVLINLISNAVKYSPAGGDILVTSRLAPGEVKVSIHDHGIGIPAEWQGRIFERFFRVGNPQTATYPGMGLGLYISAGIIYRHGGAISVESTAGQETTFIFTLPLPGG